MKKERGKRFVISEDTCGSVTVLLCVLFLGMVLAVAVITDRAAAKTALSYGERMLFLSARGVLAQYDRNLWEDYGIFAYIGNEASVEKEITESMESMGRKQAAEKRNSHLLFDVEVSDLAVSTAGGSLLNKDLVRQQIIDLMQGRTASEAVKTLAAQLGETGHILGEKRENAQTQLEKEAALQEHETKGEGEVEQREPVSFENNSDFEPEADKESGRILKNRECIENLPSKGYDKENLFSGISMRTEKDLLGVGKEAEDLVERIADAAAAVSQDWLVDQYILSYMGNAVTGARGETFFVNEAEYILQGHYSDEENDKGVQRKIFLLRTGMNLVHIYTDGKKRQVTLEAAAAISGPFAGAVQFLICVSWAALEAKNDLRVLKEGGKIPFFKKDEDWALSFSQLSEGLPENSIQAGGKNEGLDYEGYLGIFLLLTDSDTKILRCMDLIQLNMKGRYQGEFDLRNCIARFTVKALLECKQYSITPGIFPSSFQSFSVTAMHTY